MTGILGAIMTVGAKVSSMSYLTKATSQAATITIPATAQAGDFAVFFDWNSIASGTPASVVPAGWNSVSNISSTLYRSIISWRIIQTGDPGTSITGMAANAEVWKTILVWRGDVPVTSVTPSTFLGEIGDGINPALQSIAAAGQPAPVITVAESANSVNNTATFNVGSFTGTQQGPTVQQLIGYRLMNSAPVTHSVDKPQDDNQGNSLQSGYFVIS